MYNPSAFVLPHLASSKIMAPARDHETPAPQAHKSNVRKQFKKETTETVNKNSLQPDLPKLARQR